jgi:L-cystine transport system substrate-binding protein
MMKKAIVRGVGALSVGFAAVVVALAGASAAPPKTMEPGKLHVALNGDMPMTGLEDGKLIGTDGELMVLIAERLGLEVVPHMMEWSAEIQSTKQGKVDMMHGAMGWIEERSKIMLLTDPIYYFGTLLSQKKDTSWSTFEDMKGRSVATVSGFTLVPELKEVEGIGEVKLYDTTDGALRDLIAGRVDMAILVRRSCSSRSRRTPTGTCIRCRSSRSPTSTRSCRRSITSSSASIPSCRSCTTPSIRRSPRSGPTAPTSK